MKTSAWIWIIGILIVLGGGYWIWTSAPVLDGGTSMAQDAKDDSSMAPTSSAMPAPGAQGTVEMQVGNSMANATVMYDGKAFSPSTITIKAGGTVTFESTAGDMWVASGVHPTHKLYDDTVLQTHCAAGYSGPAPFDQCGKGSTYSFTFTKAGTWKYHDHINASATGSVIVQ